MMKNLKFKISILLFVPVIFLQGCSSTDKSNNVRKEIEQLEHIRSHLTDEKISAQADIYKYINLDRSNYRDIRLACRISGGLSGGIIGLYTIHSMALAKKTITLKQIITNMSFFDCLGIGASIVIGIGVAECFYHCVKKCYANSDLSSHKIHAYMKIDEKYREALKVRADLQTVFQEKQAELNNINCIVAGMLVSDSCDSAKFTLAKNKADKTLDEQNNMAYDLNTMYDLMDDITRLVEDINEAISNCKG